MYNPYIRQNDVRQRIMIVTGNGSISVQPDVVTIQFEIVTENMELQMAQTENSKRTNKVIQSLVNIGVPMGNIQTSGYTINPMFNYIDGNQVFKGYQVVHRLTIEIHSINQAGVIIDTAVKNGVNQVSNIHFSVKNKQEYYQQALTTALKDATAKAIVVAKTMNLNLDPRPIKIVENEVNQPPVVYKTFAMAKGNITTPIQPGQIVIDALVQTQFQY